MTGLCERLRDWLDNAPLSKPPYDHIRAAADRIESLEAALESIGERLREANFEGYFDADIAAKDALLSDSPQ